jgi:1-acyl-sn-glycerol-3-phosphate acyltransferase
MLLAFFINFRAFVLLLHTLAWTAIGIVVMLLNPTGRLYMYLARVGWARQALFFGGLPTTVIGLENIRPGQSYVVCSNHQSLLDIPVVVGTLPLPLRFVAKRSLFYIPIFGWSMYAAGFIPVDRGAGKKAHESLKRAAKRLTRGTCVVIFPEGTRSPDGELHSFKSGAFVIAIESGIPILPVAVKGTFQAGPKSAIRVYPHPVEVRIGAPIPSEGLQQKDRNELRARTREAILALRGETE